MIACPVSITLLHFHWTLIRVEVGLDLLIKHHKQFLKKGHNFKYAGNQELHLTYFTKHSIKSSHVFFKKKISNHFKV